METTLLDLCFVSTGNLSEHINGDRSVVYKEESSKMNNGLNLCM